MRAVAAQAPGHRYPHRVSPLTTFAAVIPMDVPVGWSDPSSVNVLHAILLLGGIPLLLFVAILVAVYVPSLVRGERLTPGAPVLENQWLGGPRSGTKELAGPDSEDSKAGGASGRW